MKIAEWPGRGVLFPTLGGDPEIGLMRVSDGSIENPKFVLGTEPIPIVEPVGTPGNIGIDGFMAELHPSPSTCRETLTTRYRRGLQVLASYAEDHNTYMEALLTYKLPVKTVLSNGDHDVAQLDNRPNRSSFDYNIYTGQRVYRDLFKELGNRSGGGHIHIGKTYEGSYHYVPFRTSENTKIQIDYSTTINEDTGTKLEDLVIKMLDKIVGVPCTILDYDGAETRREHYGNAGSFRRPDHGLEYRVLSNFWIRHPALQSLVYLLVKVALYITLYEPKLRTEICFELPDADTIQMIDEAERHTALDVVEYLKDIFGRYDDYIYPFLMTYWKLGYEELFCEDICDNWSIYRAERWPERWWGDSFWRGSAEPTIDGHMGLATYCDRMPPKIRKVFDKYIRKG